MERKAVFDLLGRRGVYASEIVHIAEVGSRVHGTNVAEQDDFDLTVVRMEGFDELVNGSIDRQSMMIRTKPNGVRSEPGDYDLNVYTLRKFAMLMAKGNPSILTAAYALPLWTEGYIDMGRLQFLALSRQAGKAYMGYMRQQLERWQGKRGQKNVTRPELIEQYGFDTKYAGHIIRLGIQGIEYLSTGKLTLPLPPASAELVRAVRTGQFSEEAALQMADHYEAGLEKAYEDSPLPEKPLMHALQGWLSHEYWKSYA